MISNELVWNWFSGGLGRLGGVVYVPVELSSADALGGLLAYPSGPGIASHLERFCSFEALLFKAC